MLLLAGFLCTAMAAGPSGLAVPRAAGGLAHPIDEGSLGVAVNPAASTADRTEIALDLGLVLSRMEQELDGEDVQRQSGGSPVPALSIAVPVGRFGIGASGTVPIARVSHQPDDGPQRFHGVDANVQAFEGELSMAWAIDDAWSIGAGARLTYMTIETSRAIDTGVLVYNLAPPTLEDAHELIGEPFLEGTQSVGPLVGRARGFSSGVRYAGPSGWGFAATYRSRMVGTLHGPVTIVPASSLNVQIVGELETTLQLPDEAVLAVAIPLGNWTLIPEINRTGWGVMDTMEGTADLQIASTDPEFDWLLVQYGIDDAAFLDAAEEIRTVTAMRDIYGQGLAARWQTTPHLQLRTGVWHSPPSIPAEMVNVGNLDFRTFDIQIGAVWQFASWATLGATVDAYAAPSRNIVDSAYASTNDPSLGTALPSADGRYALQLGRLGLTWIQKL